MKIYLFIILGMSIAIIILCAMLIQRKRRLAGLRASLDEYMNSGKALPYSLCEGELALLQNGISELVGRLELERQRAKEV